MKSQSIRAMQKEKKKKRRKEKERVKTPQFRAPPTCLLKVLIISILKINVPLITVVCHTVTAVSKKFPFCPASDFLPEKVPFFSGYVCEVSGKSSKDGRFHYLLFIPPFGFFVRFW